MGKLRTSNIDVGLPEMAKLCLMSNCEALLLGVGPSLVKCFRMVGGLEYAERRASSSPTVVVRGIYHG